MEEERLTAAVENGDTFTLALDVGDHVRCMLGDLKGATGTLVAVRAQGRVLIRVAQGVYVEVPRFCVEKLSAKAEQ